MPLSAILSLEEILYEKDLSSAVEAILEEVAAINGHLAAKILATLS
jgi:hypothetical protein